MQIFSSLQLPTNLYRAGSPLGPVDGGPSRRNLGVEGMLSLVPQSAPSLRRSRGSSVSAHCIEITLNIQPKSTSFPLHYLKCTKFKLEFRGKGPFPPLFISP